MNQIPGDVPAGTTSETGKTNQVPGGRFDYVRYDEQAFNVHEKAKEMFNDLESFIQSSMPEGRAKSLIFTKLEEALMWVGKAIRDDQVKNRGANLQEERTNQ